MSRAKLIDYYLEKSHDNSFEIDQIRKELEAKNIPDEDIRAIVRVVDNDIQTRALVKTGNSYAKQMTIAGAVLTAMGASLTVLTYTGAIDMGNSFLVLYGPFFAGLSMMFGGLARMRKD